MTITAYPAQRAALPMTREYDSSDPFAAELAQADIEIAARHAAERARIDDELTIEQNEWWDTYHSPAAERFESLTAAQEAMFELEAAYGF